MANKVTLGTQRLSWLPVRGIRESRTDSLSMPPGTAPPVMLATWPAWTQLTVPTGERPSLHLKKSQHLSSNSPNYGGVGVWEANEWVLFSPPLELTKPNS